MKGVHTKHLKIMLNTWK